MILRSNYVRSRSRGGFTAIDLIALLAVIFILVALVGLVLPFLGRSRGGSGRQMMNSTQLRGIQQGLVTYAQSNKKGGNDGYFPGLDSSGNVIPDGPETGHSGDGTEPAARFMLLLKGNFFTPEYMINPYDSRATEYEWPAVEDDPAHPLTAVHYSYAMLGIAEARDVDDDTSAIGADTRATEWRETLNTSAIVLSNRAIGTGRSDISSVWTTAGSGEWRGAVTRNDNSTSFETTAEFEQTKYGNADANAFDHLFEDEPGASDAFLVHEDASTAYSAN